MKKVLLCISSFIIFPSTAVFSQEAEICNAALSSGLKDNYYVLTEREQYDQYQKRLCDAKFSSYSSFEEGTSSFGLNVPVAKGIIGLSGDQQKAEGQFKKSYSKYCESTYFDSSYRDRFQSYSSNVSTALAESWLECQKTHVNAWLALNQLGVFLSVTPQDNFSDFTLQVARKTAAVDPITISDITPAGAMECNREGAAFKPKEKIDRREFTYTCSKNPNKSLRVSMDTSDGISNTVTIPSQTSKLSELNQKIIVINNELKGENASLKAQLQSVQSQINSVGSSKTDDTRDWATSGAKSWTATSKCADGYYVVGVTAHDSDGGGYCYNCINHIRVVCRKIK